jgi:hypothetical protein|uniref:DUF4129 domain-containing protein n=1 Tax=Eubacterium cellulosolvens (strain ATCC 43171 / JCM 9499 / 6) TaxID=633697 RepID=I5ARN8_EUBC6
MKISVELQDPFHFPVYWLLIGLVAAICGVALFVYAFRLRKKMEEERAHELRIRKPAPGAMVLIRKKYLRQLAKVQKEYSESKIDYREAYRKMSKIFRMFVYEVTGIEVQNYTLMEIKKLRIRSLTQLVSHYYKPEFSVQSKADVNKSLEKTRKVIETWN